MPARILLTMLSVLLLLPVAQLRGQGLLLESRTEHAFRLPRHWHPHPQPRPRPRPTPPPTRSYCIKDMSVQARIRDQVATVQVSQTFVNTGSQTMEVAFVFPLPYDGAIDRMTFMVDGKEHEARLLSAKEARSIYESYMRRNLDPALTEWIGTGVFKTSVFPVPAGAKRTVSLRYSQLGRLQDNVSEFLYPLSTARYTSKPIESISIDLTLQSQQPIKNVYSPTHSIQIDRENDKLVTVKYEAKGQTPGEDFRLFYDHGKKAVGTSVLSYRPNTDEDGYFLLLASPKIPKPDDIAAKTVVFAVDRSGSMSGKKMEQAKDALRLVLNNLRKGDTFNIIAYDSEVESFAPELQKFDEKRRNEALGFVAGLYAGGSTNINEALKTAMQQFQDRDRPGYLIFLTDGLPTIGEKNSAKIAQNARQWNESRIRLFAFGVGYDVNSRLLDRLVNDNHGQSAYVRPNEDIEQHVGTLARRIESPVLTDVKVRFEIDGHRTQDGPIVNRMYPGQGMDLFAGEQLVLVGRYSRPGAAKIVVKGSLSGETKKYDYRAKLRKKSKDQTHSFVEKLWAIRRVGEIIDEIDLNGSNDELVDELTALSKKHGIMTPYTSFLAEEETNLNNRLAIRADAVEALSELRNESGQNAFRQRAAKGVLRRNSRVAADRLYSADLAAPTTAAQPLSAAGGGFGGRVGGVPALRSKLTHAGDKAFYHREGRWMDSEIKDGKPQDAKQVVRFTKEYFDLAERYGKRVTRYLALDGDVYFEFEGAKYLVVNPPQTN